MSDHTQQSIEALHALAKEQSEVAEGAQRTAERHFALGAEATARRDESRRKAASYERTARDLVDQAHPMYAAATDEGCRSCGARAWTRHAPGCPELSVGAADTDALAQDGAVSHRTDPSYR
jgi:hypothetical protein